MHVDAALSEGRSVVAAGAVAHSVRMAPIVRGAFQTYACGPILVLTALGLLATTASAAEQSASLPSLELTWDAPRECPAVAEVKESVARIVGEEAAIAERETVRVRGLVRREQGQFHVEIDAERGDTRGRRSVWRTARQLGVAPEAVDDVVQEIFVVVHRRYGDFEGRSSVRTWLFAITRRIVADHRKSKRRKHATPTEPTTFDTFASHERPIERLEAFDLVCVLLDTLDETKREVFVLAELEGMTLAEIAEATSTNPNTVAARLRAARAAFGQALTDYERVERWAPR